MVVAELVSDMPAPPRSPAIIVAAFALMAGGCGTATIVRHGGPPLQASIDRSDAQALYVTSDEGARYRIEGRDVVSVDHPGNLGVGVALLGLAVASLAAFIALDPPDDPERGSGFVAIPRLMALTGLVICLPSGIVLAGTNLRSRSAAGSLVFPAAPAPGGGTPP